MDILYSEFVLWSTNSDLGPRSREKAPRLDSSWAHELSPELGEPKGIESGPSLHGPELAVLAEAVEAVADDQTCTRASS